jgi:hypothetical protein
LDSYFALGVFVAVFFGFFLSFFLSLFPIFKLLSTRVNLILALIAIRASLIQWHARVPVRILSIERVVVHAVLDAESGETQQIVAVVALGYALIWVNYGLKNGKC